MNIFLIFCITSSFYRLPFRQRDAVITSVRPIIGVFILLIARSPNSNAMDSWRITIVTVNIVYTGGRRRSPPFIYTCLGVNPDCIKTVQAETYYRYDLCQNVCVFGTISTRNDCSFCCMLTHIICLCRSRVNATFCAARQNPVCATFYIHRRNRHESFNHTQKSKFVRTQDNDERKLLKHLLVYHTNTGYIALFTASASQRLQFTNRKRKEYTSKTLT